jgi:hypothetical protein
MKLVLLILGGIIGWLIGVNFWVFFKILGIILGGYLTFTSLVLYGFSGNSEDSSYPAFFGTALIVAIAIGWFASSSYTIDGIGNSISSAFSVEKKVEEKKLDSNNLAETLKQLEEAGVISINHKKEGK